MPSKRSIRQTKRCARSAPAPGPASHHAGAGVVTWRSRGVAGAHQMRADNEQRQRDRRQLETFATRAQTGECLGRAVEQHSGGPDLGIHESRTRGPGEEAGRSAHRAAAVHRFGRTRAAAAIRSRDPGTSADPSLARMLARDLGEVVAVTKPQTDTALGQLARRAEPRDGAGPSHPRATDGGRSIPAPSIRNTKRRSSDW